jgi:hypothetical protein
VKDSLLLELNKVLPRLSAIGHAVRATGRWYDTRPTCNPRHEDGMVQRSLFTRGPRRLHARHRHRTRILPYALHARPAPCHRCHLQRVKDRLLLELNKVLPRLIYSISVVFT